MTVKTRENFVRVWPKNKKIREGIQHPIGGGFTDDPEGTEWPEDQFTFRRIEDGDILDKAPASARAAQEEAAGAQSAEAKSKPADTNSKRA